MGNETPRHEPDHQCPNDHCADDYEGPREECGVFGVWAPGEEVAKLAYFGLYALQHRGQEAAGIAVSDGSQVLVFKDLGLVSQVFDEQVLSSLSGHIAIGHCRYSTTGASIWENAQPTFRTTATGSGLALGHNGNLVNTAELLEQARKVGAPIRNGATTDSDLITGLLATGAADTGIENAAQRLLPQLRGAFSLVFCDEGTLYAARDPQGVRPLVLGRLERGWVLASETAALDIVGANFVREVEPGELLAIDASGLRSSRFANPDPKGCVFEYVYLARPDTTIAGRGVHATRVEIGRRLAIEHPADADLVIPVPESGTPAAI
ncbi:MAG: amidophosphoribosyltransferase, partial [Pseudonocardiaceae bacterium]